LPIGGSVNSRSFVTSAGSPSQRSLVNSRSSSTSVAAET
jgi:hypothetical protein